MKSREERLVKEAVARFHLDLKDMVVLTEAATGHYVWTPIIAAVAGASRVLAVTKDSKYGSSTHVMAETESWAEELGVQEKIEIYTKDLPLNKPLTHAEVGQADIVTNLGFVRPIHNEFIKSMKKGAVVSLMCEPWECREFDVDIRACRFHGIPVMGTDENTPNLDTFGYIGMLVVKLALEMGVEVRKSRILVLGSGYRGKTGIETLTELGADTKSVNDVMDITTAKASMAMSDLLVVVEPFVWHKIIGESGFISIKELVSINPALKIVHIAGNIDTLGLLKKEIMVNPTCGAATGHMAVSLGYLGPKPVIDLHTAGLKVGQELARGMRMKGSVREAEFFTQRRAPALKIGRS